MRLSRTKIAVYEKLGSPLTSSKTRALPSNAALVPSTVDSDTTTRNDRATGSTKKERVSINVYSGSSAVIYLVDAEILAPIVARFVSQLDSLSQVNCTKIK